MTTHILTRKTPPTGTHEVVRWEFEPLGSEVIVVSVTAKGFTEGHVLSTPLARKEWAALVAKGWAHSDSAARRATGVYEAPKPRPGVCCEKARTSYACVCSHFDFCPDHGERHYGTHD